MEQPLQTHAPPEPPERPVASLRFPAWPWWFALVGFLVGFVGSQILLAIPIALLSGGETPDSTSPEVVVLGTLALGVGLLGSAYFFASRVAPPRPWHFGLRATRFWPAVGWAAVGLLAFFVASGVYAALVQPDVEQTTVQDLGGDQGTIGLVVAGLMVIVVAPVVEEIFFRGFFYRALRTRLGVLSAAAVDGLVFGSIHFQFDGADGLLILPPLMLLGFVYCLVYERTGSLFPVIGLHAFNNALAYLVQADDGWQVSVVAGPLMLAAVAVVPRLLPRTPLPKPA
jgi:membrane protease YdiL (CAAX protease family)